MSPIMTDSWAKSHSLSFWPSAPVPQRPPDNPKTWRCSWPNQCPALKCKVWHTMSKCTHERGAFVKDKIQEKTCCCIEIIKIIESMEIIEAYRYPQCASMWSGVDRLEVESCQYCSWLLSIASQRLPADPLPKFASKRRTIRRCRLNGDITDTTDVANKNEAVVASPSVGQSFLLQPLHSPEADVRLHPGSQARGQEWYPWAPQTSRLVTTVCQDLSNANHKKAV